MRVGQVRYEPSSNMKRVSDVWLERRGRYFSMAATGQVDVCVALMVMVHVW